MCDREHSSANKPRQSAYGAYDKSYGDYQKIQMITISLFEFIFSTIDNDRSDLMIHKNQNWK